MKKTGVIGILTFLFLLTGGTVSALSSEELQILLEKNVNLTLIDIRSNQEYGRGHIPGAINLPARLLGAKKLPPLGVVVIYGDGLDPALEQKAAEALAAKGVKQVRVLEGGFPAWSLPASGSRGLQNEPEKVLDYSRVLNLVREDPACVVLDLRQTPRGNLAAELGEVTILRPAGSPGTDSPAAGLGQLDPGKLYILIDDGDGRAEKTARLLRTTGLKRLVILLGGEPALLRKGTPGELKTLKTITLIEEESL